MKKVALVLVGLFLFPPAGFGVEKFSKRAWEEAAPIYQEIEKHPFNRELKAGTLPKEKFAYYSEQDALYLRAYAQALGILATRLDDPADAKWALEMADECLNEAKVAPASQAMPANFMYSQFLLATAAFKSKEELAAALLPCFWVYLRVARAMQPEVLAGNPYKTWVDTYASEKYEKAVNEMIALTDKLAAKASPSERQRMLEAYKIATRLEWNFWQDSYQLAKWAP